MVWLYHMGIGQTSRKNDVPWFIMSLRNIIIWNSFAFIRYLHLTIFICMWLQWLKCDYAMAVWHIENYRHTVFNDTSIVDKKSYSLNTFTVWFPEWFRLLLYHSIPMLRSGTATIQLFFKTIKRIHIWTWNTNHLNHFINLYCLT